MPILEQQSSPSPSLSPTPAVSSCPSPDRTFSTASSLSTSSATSADARSSVSISTRRRGYIRAQGAEFAASARNRESVMSLGSIAHLQYYFARTGLLDGKGGNAREYKKKNKNPDEVPQLLLTPNARFIDDLSLSPTEEGVTDQGENTSEVNEEVMLPPTVSTYSMKTHHIPPPPDLLQLRRDLLNAIWKAQQEMDAIAEGLPSPEMLPPQIDLPPDANPDPEDDSQRQEDLDAARKNVDEIQGMRILDVVTLAIRAARIYYTAHEHPERLAFIRSEREIRQDLFNVLEVLKRWAGRNFAGGLREDEHKVIRGWMTDVRDMLSQEAQLEDAEVKERAGWVWIEGDWTGREREREDAFLGSLSGSDAPLPAWTAPEDGSLPSAFLERLRDGRDLVRIHNQAVKKSKRPFGEIKSFHEDVAKPYRRADNLRFWIKAAELRWETKLEMDVMGVVHGSSEEAWHQFDKAILAWYLRASPGSSGCLLSMRANSSASVPPLDLSPDTPTSTSVSQAPPPPPTPSVSVSSAKEPSPRRIKSKSSLRSIRSIGSSSHHEDDFDDDPSDKSLIRPSILRRLSPGLAARVKLLDGSAKTATASRHHPGTVGRIPEEQIKELDSLHHQADSIKVERKGRAWNGISLKSRSRKQQPDREQQQQQTLDVPEPSSVADPIPGSEQDVPSDRPETKQGEVEDTPTTMSVVESAPAPLGAETCDSNAEGQAEAQTDFEKYIQTTSQVEEDNGASPPSPPPKDSSRPLSTASSSNIQSYFNLSRPASIYSFSRSSFSNQISQLTSITLPQPQTLAASISAIPNAPSAVKALTSAAEQIQYFIQKASDVLSGLDAEDDVEWAAAGGREGLDGVDKAITKFGSLVNVYVQAIEDVQVREDIPNVSTESLETIVTQMDDIIRSWADIKTRLRNVKEQVELAMEWEELWNTVLGEVGLEITNLNRLIFEMEERRHSGVTDTTGMDINELETIVEEKPSDRVRRRRSSLGSIHRAPPALDAPVIQTPQDDVNTSNLHELFARLQPLRASLDFLPMRMSMFQSRAEEIFPSAYYSNLQKDAETLQKELAEDRWIMKMFESVERSISKLQEGLESGMHLHNPSGMSTRIENYEAKKQHYVPAIERVLSIIQKGVKDRLTAMTSKVDALKASVKHLKTQHMRDSISTILSMDSPATGTSSVVMTPANKSTAPLGSSTRRGSSVSSSARTTMGRRLSGKSSVPKPSLRAPSPNPNGSTTPTPATRKSTRPALSPAILNRPRWNTSTNTSDLESSRRALTPSRLSRPASTVPGQSRRDPSASPAPPTVRSASRVSSRLGSRSPAPSSILDPPPYSKLRRPAGMESMNNTPRSRQSFAGMSFSRSVSRNQDPGVASPTKTTRPGTSLGHSGSRRISLLPLPKSRKENAPATRSKLAERPPWRG
ncbi:cortical protein KAR9-domain-containing protein [Aspergillus egyptiacus]|nr:cortical protein KAR9-domain-containing protein [Aspergillus egyptiacus]